MEVYVAAVAPLEVALEYVPAAPLMGVLAAPLMVPSAAPVAAVVASVSQRAWLDAAAPTILSNSSVSLTCDFFSCVSRCASACCSCSCCVRQLPKASPICFTVSDSCSIPLSDERWAMCALSERKRVVIA